MNVSNFESAKTNELKQMRKKQIQISINRAPSSIFPQNKQSNIATSYKESSEKIRIQHIEKKQNAKKLVNFQGKNFNYSNFCNVGKSINTSNSLNSQRILKENTFLTTGANHSNHISINTSYYPKNVGTGLNESNTLGALIGGRCLNGTGNYTSNNSTKINFTYTNRNITLNETLTGCGGINATCGNLNNTTQTKDLMPNEDKRVIANKNKNSKETFKTFIKQITSTKNSSMKNKKIKEPKVKKENKTGLNLIDENFNLTKQTFKMFIKTNKPLSLVNIKQKYKELIKNKSIPTSLLIKSVKHPSDDTKEQTKQINPSQTVRDSMHFKQKSSVTLNENAKQVNCSKKNSISVPKSKQSSSTRNPISININKLSLRSLIQDNCVNVKSKTGKLTAMTNFNQVKEDKFSREEEENLDVEERNSNDGFNFNSLIPNTSMTEFDNFDDINSIVKKLNFDKIDPKRENIFSQNNFVYKNFEEKFNEEFEAFKHRSHNKRVNYSASTKDNSSSKKGYPYQRE